MREPVQSTVDSFDRPTAMSTNVNKVVWWEIKDSQNDVDNNLLITKIDDHQKLSAPIRVAKLFAKTATVFAAAESVSLYGNEVNTHIHTTRVGKRL